MTTINIPLVSVLVPSFNHAEYIEETLKSILGQRGLGEVFDVELIVIDDASTDATFSIASTLLATQDVLARLEVRRKTENRGLKDSIKEALALARGEYIQVLASDDCLDIDKLLHQVSVLEADGNVSAIYGRCTIQSEGVPVEVLTYDQFEAILLSRNRQKMIRTVCVPSSPLPLAQSALFRTPSYRNLFDRYYSLMSNDWCILIGLMCTDDIAYSNATGVIYRLHESNLHKDRPLMLLNQLQVIESVVPPGLRRHSLQAVLMIQALTYFSMGKIRRSLFAAWASLVLTGVLRPWGLFAVRWCRRALGRRNTTTPSMFLTAARHAEGASGHSA